MLLKSPPNTLLEIFTLVLTFIARFQFNVFKNRYFWFLAVFPSFFLSLFYLLTCGRFACLPLAAGNIFSSDWLGLVDSCVPIGWSLKTLTTAEEGLGLCVCRSNSVICWEWKFTDLETRYCEFPRYLSWPFVTFPFQIIFNLRCVSSLTMPELHLSLQLPSSRKNNTE